MLFSSIVYGPIHSRRLGISLGMNLMPTASKLCTYNCVYCECGFNTPVHQPELPARDEVRQALERALQTFRQENTDGDKLSTITFSGNGEPTLHPDFLGIIQDTCALRDQYCPEARVSVLSNATQLGRDDVVQALHMCDNRILKLDSALTTTMQRIDMPVNESLTADDIIGKLKLFDGDFTLQTCFLRGEYRGRYFDNTTPDELDAYYRAVRLLHPKQLMLYVIDRATPVKTLEKITRDEMERIAAPLREQGYDILVSA